MVRRCPSCTASMAAMRPLIAAEPMLRAPRPEMVAESTLTGPDDCGLAGCGVCARTATPAASATPRSVDESQRGNDESRRVIIVFISRESFCQSPFFASSVLLRFRLGGRLPSARRFLGGLFRGGVFPPPAPWGGGGGAGGAPPAGASPGGRGGGLLRKGAWPLFF